jgi:hypothetical protein
VIGGKRVMAVDDHAIDSLKVWFELEYDELKTEWKSGQYPKLSDCPSYEGAVAYREAMNVLIKACYLPGFAIHYKIRPLMYMINEELKVEKFWKEQSEGKLLNHDGDDIGNDF